MADDRKGRSLEESGRQGVVAATSRPDTARRMTGRRGPTRIFAAETRAVEEDARSRESCAFSPSARGCGRFVRLPRLVRPWPPRIRSVSCARSPSARVAWSSSSTASCSTLPAGRSALRTRSLDVVDAAQTAQTRAASLVAETDRLRRRLVPPARSKSRAGPCPVCGEAADSHGLAATAALGGRSRGVPAGLLRRGRGARMAGAGLVPLARAGSWRRGFEDFARRKQEAWLTVTPPRSSESVGRLTIRTRRPERW